MHGTYSARFEKALTYAYKKHAAQTRKGSGIPYMSHLMAVCALVMENGGNEDQAIAALLHDAVEDQGGRETGDEIERLFGSGVRRLVDGCTDTEVQPKPPWRARKEAYLAHLRTSDADVRLVSCCDKLHNARTLLADLRQVGPSMWLRFKVGAGEQLWYFRSLTRIFRETGGPHPLVDELERVVDDLEAAVAASAL